MTGILLETKYLSLFIFFGGLCPDISKASQCTDRGRYPNNDDSDCRGFTICLIGGPSNFTQYKITCPEDFIYSHIEKRCTNSTSYHCFPTYNCTYPGNQVNAESSNCTSYISCVEGITDFATARLVQCPSYTVFNPVAESCVNESEYKCNIKKVDMATVVELEDDLLQLYDSFNFNSAIENCVKRSLLLYIMTILFVFQ